MAPVIHTNITASTPISPQLSFADYDTFSTILSPNTFVYPVKNRKHPKVGMLLMCPYTVSLSIDVSVFWLIILAATKVLLSVSFSGAIRPCARLVADVLVREVVLGVYGVTRRAVLAPMADFPR